MILVIFYHIPRDIARKKKIKFNKRNGIRYFILIVLNVLLYLISLALVFYGVGKTPYMIAHFNLTLGIILTSLYVYNKENS